MPWQRRNGAPGTASIVNLSFFCRSSAGRVGGKAAQRNHLVKRKTLGAGWRLTCVGLRWLAEAACVRRYAGTVRKTGGGSSRANSIIVRFEGFLKGSNAENRGLKRLLQQATENWPACRSNTFRNTS
jgi:hypothetical protein